MLYSERKTVLITGAARRIGRSLAVRFARQGYNVCIHYNTSEEQALAVRQEVVEQGVSAELYQADIRSDEQVAAMLRRVGEDFGSVDVLVSNAAIYPTRRSLEEIPPNFVEDLFSVNCLAHYRLVREWLPVAPDNAHAVLFTSLGAHETWKGRLPYNVSKAAAAQLVRSLSRELAPRIAVNAVAPGSIEFHDDPATEPLIPIHKIPMARQGTPDDIFAAVYFFATCPTFITGQEILVDGGYHYSR